MPKEEAHGYIFGYTILNDVSARDMQTNHQQFFFSKSLDGSAPMGPCIVTADEIPDPQTLDLWLTVNGEIKQKSNTRHMLFKVKDLVSDISQGITLQKKAETSRRIGIAGLVIPLAGRIFTERVANGDVCAPGMLIP